MALITEEHRWAFELDGYILLPSLLSASAAAPAKNNAATRTVATGVLKVGQGSFNV